MAAQHARLAQRFVEQRACPTDERASCGVFLLAWSLADNHQRRTRVALAEHDLRACLRQRAGDALLGARLHCR
jgi:hypothetical protein